MPVPSGRMIFVAAGSCFEEISVLVTLVACLLVQAPPSDAAKKARAELDVVRAGIEKMMKLRERHQQLGEEDAKLREQLQAGSDDEERLKKLAKKREELEKVGQDLGKESAFGSTKSLYASREF